MALTREQMMEHWRTLSSAQLKRYRRNKDGKSTKAEIKMIDEIIKERQSWKR